MTEKYYKIRGLRWRVQERGHGEPVLFLHGFTGSGDVWRPVVERLSGGYHCILADVVGHGGTEAPNEVERYTMASVAKDLVELMDGFGYREFTVVGYSMGGRLALYLTVHYKDRVKKLVLESASPGLATAEERADRTSRDEQLANEIEQFGLKAFVDKWERLPLFATQTRISDVDRERQRQTRLGQREVGLANSLRGMGTGAQPSLWEDLRNLEMPVLLITGEEDAKFCAVAEKMQESLPNARHVVVPEAGHTVHLEQGKEYVERVQFFLQSKTEG